MKKQLLFIQGGGADVHDQWDNKLVESLEQLALDRVADEKATPRGVAIDPQSTQRASIALIPAPLAPPEAPTPQLAHRHQLGRSTRIH